MDVDRRAGRLGVEEYREKLGEVLARRERAAASGPSSTPPGLSEAYALVAKELRLAKRYTRADRAGTERMPRLSSTAAASLGHRFSTSSLRPGTSGSAAGGGSGGGGAATSRERPEKSGPLSSDARAASHVTGGELSSGGSGGSGVSGGAVPFLTGSARHSRWQAPAGGGGRSAGQTAGASAGLGGFDTVGWSGRAGGSGSGGGVGAAVANGGGADSKVMCRAALRCVTPTRRCLLLCFFFSRCLSSVSCPRIAGNPFRTIYQDTRFVRCPRDVRDA